MWFPQIRVLKKIFYSTNCYYLIYIYIFINVIINVFWVVYKAWKDQAVYGKWDVKDVTGWTEEWGAIQLGVSMWFSKRAGEKSL
jgi:hypothetical protein